MKRQDSKVFVVMAGVQEVLRRGSLVDQIWVEDVELVSLDDLGRRVVEVVVRLVVLVPLKTSVHTIEEAWFPGAIFVCPQVHLPRNWNLHTELGLVVAHALLGSTDEGVFSTLISIT